MYFFGLYISMICLRTHYDITQKNQSPVYPKIDAGLMQISVTTDGYHPGLKK
jgi:hypothetical protein